MRSPALRAVLDAAIPDAQRQHIADRYGVDLERASEAVVATYPAGWLAIVRGPFDARTTVQLAEAEMDSVSFRASTPYPRVEGHFATDAMHAAALDDDVLAVGTAIPEVEAGLFACARGHCERAIDGESEELAAARAERSITLLAPTPIEIPPEICDGCGVSLLFARQRAIAASIRAQGDAALALELEVRGEFPDTAEENFTALVQSIATSSLGAAFGMNDAIASLLVRKDDRGVRLQLALDARAVSRGLRDLFTTEVRDVANAAAAPTGS